MIPGRSGPRGPFFYYWCRDVKRSRKAQELESLLRPTIVGMGYELLGIEFFPQGKGALLRIYIDTPAGVTVEDCERVSHQVGGVLDVEDPISGHYVLEVSSPGLDRPLFTPDQYRRFIGEEITVRLMYPLEGRRKFTGVLQDVVGDDDVIIADGGMEIRLPLKEIEKARLVPHL